MFPDFFQPAVSGQANVSHNHVPADFDPRASFQTIPMNLSPDEIRAMVRDILG